MNAGTVKQLRDMKLNALLGECLRQEELPAMKALSFEDRLSLAVDAEFQERKNRKERRLIKAAEIRDPTATLAGINFAIDRGINERLIAEYSSMQWVDRGENMVVTGPTGIGKTFILSAFAREGCLQNKTVRYFRAPRLLTALEIGRGDGTFEKKLGELVKPELLVLDDFGLQKFDFNLCLDFLEVIEERYVNKKSIIIGTQLPVSHWPEVFEDRTVADGIMDRLIQNACRITLKGPSLRKTNPEKLPQDP